MTYANVQESYYEKTKTKESLVALSSCVNFFLSPKMTQCLFLERKKNSALTKAILASVSFAAQLQNPRKSLSTQKPTLSSIEGMRDAWTGNAKSLLCKWWTRQNSLSGRAHIQLFRGHFLRHLISIFAV